MDAWMDGWMDGWRGWSQKHVPVSFNTKSLSVSLENPLYIYPYEPIKHSEFGVQSPTKRITPGCGSKPNLAFQVS